ncbi:MAG: hypothetical protein ACK4HL_13955 [Aestuariivirga sp.]
MMNVLQGSMGLADALRDVGATGDLIVRLGRQDGLLLLEIVTGLRDPSAEVWSQRGRALKPGVHSLKVAGITFEWPAEAEAGIPAGDEAANDNSPRPLRVGMRGSDGETPALR